MKGCVQQNPVYNRKDFCLQWEFNMGSAGWGLTQWATGLPIAVELQWLEQTWDHENKFQPKVSSDVQGQFLYKLHPMDQKLCFSQAG